MICNRCDYDNPDDRISCEKCGNPLHTTDLFTQDLSLGEGINIDDFSRSNDGGPVFEDLDLHTDPLPNDTPTIYGDRPADYKGQTAPTNRKNVLLVAGIITGAAILILCILWFSKIIPHPGNSCESGENSPVVSVGDNAGSNSGGNSGKAEPKGQDNPFANAKVGDTVSFASYEGGAIKWRVLEVTENKALVISEFSIASMPFDVNGSSNWANSSLRTWMSNGLYAGFTDEEKALIEKTTLTSSKNAVTGLSDTSTCSDYLFILGMDEVGKYFPSDKDRLAYATDTAKNQGIDVMPEYKASPYWVRTPGDSKNKTAYVRGRTGGFDEAGYDTTCTTHGVRPAMWVKTS